MFDVSTWRRAARFALVAAPTVTLLAAGCGDGGTTASDDSGTTATSEEEAGTLTIYSGRDEELVQPILDRLSEETGLELEVRYGDTAELAAQLLEEGDRTEADLYFAQDAGALGALVQAGMFTELPDDILNQVPEIYRATDGTWVGLSGRSRVIVYDPEEIDSPPDSVHDVTDPEWEGLVGVAPTNGSFQAFVTALRVIEGDDAAEQWLEDLQDNDVQLYEGNRDMLDALENGEIALSLNNHYYWYERVKEEGEDAVSSELHYLPGGDPGGIVNVAGAGVLASSDNPEGAQAALEFLLGEEAQQYFTDETSEYPLVEGVESSADLPALDDLEHPDIDLSDLHSLDETLAMLERVGLV